MAGGWSIGAGSGTSWDTETLSTGWLAPQWALVAFLRPECLQGRCSIWPWAPGLQPDNQRTALSISATGSQLLLAMGRL